MIAGRKTPDRLPKRRSRNAAAETALELEQDFSCEPFKQWESEMKSPRLTAVTMIVVATAAPSFSAGLPEIAENNYFTLVAASFERQNMSTPIASSPRVTTDLPRAFSSTCD